MAKNIVILTMGLNIGGAETHIVELAGALRRKGHTVTVFSNGGVFEEQLKTMDVNHITAPMNSKKPSSLIRSYKILKRFCKSQRVSIIHSHTRITNYIAHLICKKLDIPMVTTVHFNFKLNLFTKAFSRWGSRQLSVSEDLRQYVAKGYGVDPEKVRITVNGINLNTFSHQKNPALRKEYGLNEGHKVVLCVSRIDTGACENVFHFLESAKEIYAALPEARIVIVGNGNKFEELKKTAAAINKVTTENYIQLAGARTNIADYLHMADAFAGVSRSALEAMACKLPTIIIGNQGYLGVYSEEILPACIDTNFTCRGYAYATPHEVAEIMIRMLSTPEYYAENIRLGYELIKARYSVDAMAEDALASYNEAENDNRPCDLMVSGYYGTHNFGDDITLRAIIDNVSAQYPLQSIAVLCHNAGEQLDPRVTVLHRFNLLKILPLMKKTKLFMLGGGSLLQDVTSNRSLFYYLFMLRHAEKYGCKTMIYANGIGPLLKPAHQRQVARVLKKVDRITLRDKNSYDTLLQSGLPADKLVLTADEAYCYNYRTGAPVPAEIKNHTLLINLRPFYLHPVGFHSAIAEAIDSVCTRHKLHPVLLPVQFAQDKPELEKVASRLKTPFTLIDRALDSDAVIACIEHSEYLFTERLHPFVFASRMGKPAATLVYDPKVAAASERFITEAYSISLAEFSAEKCKKVLCALIENKAEISASLSPTAKEVYAAATKNAQIAGELLGE